MQVVDDCAVVGFQLHIFLIFFVRELWFNNFIFGNINYLVRKVMQKSENSLSDDPFFYNMCIKDVLHHHTSLWCYDLLFHN